MNNWPLHGGDLISAQAHYTGTLLDFSVNLNPLGMPPAVAQAAREGVEASVSYPDPQCRALRRAIGEMDGVPTTYIFCGNGAADLLLRLALTIRPKRAMVMAPTFGEYERALHVVGSKVFYHYLKPERQFDLEEGFLRALRPDLDLLVLCNPNNPTGRLIPPDFLEKIVAFCERHQIWLLVDESFLLLTDGGANWGLVTQLEQCPHLMVLRSMTKTWAMPGLRLGYLLSSNPRLTAELADCGQPWAVSEPAQRAGVAACHCLSWAEAGRRMIQSERPKLQRGLEARGFEVTDSVTNYLLFRGIRKEHLQKQLLEQGILVRSCANFRGLGPEWYRVAVRSGAENQRLLQTLTRLEEENHGT